MTYIFYIYGFILLQLKFYLNFFTQEATRVFHVPPKLVKGYNKIIKVLWK